MTYVHISSSAEPGAPFRLDSLESAPAPQGCDGTWQRYVITQGGNTIVGMRCGMRSEVSLVLEDYIERLNARFAKGRKPAR